jgi:hypothetical protein
MPVAFADLSKQQQEQQKQPKSVPRRATGYPTYAPRDDEEDEEDEDAMPSFKPVVGTSAENEAPIYAPSPRGSRTSNVRFDEEQGDDSTLPGMKAKPGKKVATVQLPGSPDTGKMKKRVHVPLARRDTPFPGASLFRKEWQKPRRDTGHPGVVLKDRHPLCCLVHIKLIGLLALVATISASAGAGITYGLNMSSECP